MHVEKKAGWVIPGPEEQWNADKIFVDGVEIQQIFRFQDDVHGHYHLIRLLPGVHKIRITGTIQRQTTLFIHDPSPVFSLMQTNGAWNNKQ